MQKLPTYTKVNVEYNLSISLAIAIFLIPARLLISWCSAVIAHELGHWIALKLLKISVVSVSLTAYGVKMETENLLPYEELICSAAGPVCSILLLLTAERLPLIALCGGIHCIFNLLPVLPLDGGRIVSSLIELCIPGRGEVIMRRVSCSFFVVMLLVIIILLYFKLLSAALVIAIVVGRCICLKISCKE